MKKFACFSALFLLLLLHSQAHPQTLTWTAGGVGGGWYAIAGGIANLVNEKSGGITIKVIPGGGTVNPRLVDKGDCELGWGLPFLNVAAWNGEDPYDKKHTNLRALAGGMSLNFFHFYVAAESPIKTMDDVFKQKKALRMAISPAGTSDEWVFRKVLAAYKTDYKELEAAGFKFFRGSYAEQASQFKDKNVDSVFTFLATPAAAVTEASIGRSLRLIPFAPEVLESLKQYGIESGKIPAGTYPKAANANEEILTAVAGSVILINKNVPDEVAYRMTKVIHENLDQFRKIHGSLVPYQIKDGVTGLGAIPLHPGAEKYFREKGVLK
ncbi:MAG: TAXI family TRAP transporter solute-binding subunit [Desulfobacterota bacterium]|nr:TAXI family TRAP transporter solute-binding subunit [Thermodesulfobacteriota bacterium]